MGSQRNFRKSQKHCNVSLRRFRDFQRVSRKFQGFSGCFWRSQERFSLRWFQGFLGAFQGVWGISEDFGGLGGGGQVYLKGASAGLRSVSEVSRAFWGVFRAFQGNFRGFHVVSGALQEISGVFQGVSGSF